MNKWLVVINPSSGNGKGKRNWETISQELISNDFDFVPAFTQHEKHAIDLVAENIGRGFRKIIVVGGDGTLNEAVNGVMSQTLVPTEEIAIGFIPVGTGNDWGRMYGISKNLKKSVEIIKNEDRFLQDVGKIEFRNNPEMPGRYFLNIAGAGYDGEVVLRTTNKRKKGKGSKFAYFANLVSGFFAFKPEETTIEIDGRVYKNEFLSMNIGVCRYSGGGMRQVPKAIPNDGLLDITLIKKMSFLSVLLSLGKLYSGNIGKHRKVELSRGSNVDVISNAYLPVEIDGECVGNAPFSVSILKEKICILAGEKKF